MFFFRVCYCVHYGAQETDFTSDPVSASTNAVSKVWETPEAVLAQHKDAVTAADWLSGGSDIVSGGWDSSVLLWDVGKFSLPFFYIFYF
jgi:WD40 repeat protein